MVEKDKNQATQLPLPEPVASDGDPKYVPPSKAKTVFKPDGKAQRPSDPGKKEVVIEEGKMYW